MKNITNNEPKCNIARRQFLKSVPAIGITAGAVVTTSAQAALTPDERIASAFEDIRLAMIERGETEDFAGITEHFHTMVNINKRKKRRASQT